MFLIFLNIISIFMFSSQLLEQLHKLDESVSSFSELIRHVNTLEVCSRFYTLKRNIEQSAHYLDIESDLGTPIIEAWSETIQPKVRCREHISAIAVYYEHSIKLEPLYPNWTYRYDLSTISYELSTDDEPL